jgi:hypothetical protein
LFCRFPIFKVFVPEVSANSISHGPAEFFYFTATTNEMVENLVVPKIDGCVIWNRAAYRDEESVRRLPLVGSRVDYSEATLMKVFPIEIETMIPPIIRSRIIRELKAKVIRVKITDQSVAISRSM